MRPTAMGPEGPLLRPRHTMKTEAPSTRAIPTAATGNGTHRMERERYVVEDPGTRGQQRDGGEWHAGPQPGEKDATISGEQQRGRHEEGNLRLQDERTQCQAGEPGPSAGQ